MDFKVILDEIGKWLANQGIRVVISIVVLIVSFILINKILTFFEKKAIKAKKIDKTIASSLFYIGKIVLKGLIVIMIIGFLGIDTSSITAVLASLGVAAGLAINGTLSNLAGGVMLLITRPFKVDDFIEACSQSGTVLAIHITYTEIVSPDNRIIHLPNGTLSTTTIINYTENGKRRVDMVFSIAYKADAELAKKLLADACAEHSLILDAPETVIRTFKLNSSSVDIVCRPWVKAEDYWTVYFDITEKAKELFDKNGIEIPFNQLDIHVDKKI